MPPCTYQLSKMNFVKTVILTMLQRVLQSYMVLQRTSTSSVSKMFFRDGCPSHIKTSLMICRENQWTGFYMIAFFVMKELRYIKMITWFLFPYILTQGKFRKSCLWKINLFCYIGRKSLREGIIAKNCKDLWGFFLEYWYKWIPLSFALDIILLKKFHLMSLEDVIRINVFRKSVVAIRDWYKNISNF